MKAIDLVELDPMMKSTEGDSNVEVGLTDGTLSARQADMFVSSANYADQFIEFSYIPKKDDVTRDILIYGAGGGGIELAFYLSSAAAGNGHFDKAWCIKGFIDDDANLSGRVINEIPVLGGRDYLRHFSGNVAVTVLGSPYTRRDLVQNLQTFRHLKFPTIISPTSIVAPQAKISAGCIVNIFCSISPSVVLGDFAFINSRTGIGHHAVIGDFSLLYAGVTIGGNARIGSCCVIGSSATILPGVTIGDGAVIGGGAVVTRDIPPNVVAAGVPAKIIREL